MLLVRDKLCSRCLDFKWGTEFSPAGLLRGFKKVYGDSCGSSGRMLALSVRGPGFDSQCVAGGKTKRRMY